MNAERLLEGLGAEGQLASLDDVLRLRPPDPPLALRDRDRLPRGPGPGERPRRQRRRLHAEDEEDEHWGLLKWLRTRDPPCPWTAETEAAAIEHFGEEEVRSWSA